ncbi:Hypothetical predicted protein, partial [Paramuricea clavata]
KSKYVELRKKTAVNLQHVLTQDQERLPVHVTKDIVEMGKVAKKSKYVELHKKIAVNLRHVLTHDLEPIHVPVMKDIPGMEKLVMVRKCYFALAR